MVRIRFDGPPGPVAPRFVETEDDSGRGIKLGHWEPDPDTDNWFLVLTRADMIHWSAVPARKEAEA